MTDSVELRFVVGERAGDVSGLLLRPDGARLIYVLAHGAGAGMRHPFLESISSASRSGVSRLCGISFPTWRCEPAGPIRRPWPPRPCGRR